MKEPLEYAFISTRKQEPPAQEDLDEETDEYEEDRYHPAEDYAYFSFVDYDSKEYEASRIKDGFSIFEYSAVLNDKGTKPVVILVQG